MTRRERLLAVFRGEPVDRTPVKLWSAVPDQGFLHPAYEQVHRLAVERTDLMDGSGSPFDLYCGRHRQDFFKSHEVPTESEAWVEVVTTVETPGGPLRDVFTRSTCGQPGYQAEHLLKEPEDIKTLLSLPYEPYPFSPDTFMDRERRMGDAGIVIYGLDHAMYGLQRVIGSENFALWSRDHPGLLAEAVELFAQRIQDHAKAALAGGLGHVFGWVGPELCVPPLMSPLDFEELVTAFDKPLCDLIHDGGGAVWVHSHGKMGPVLERFVHMGADVLNPIEPPPMGDMTIEEAFTVVGDRMGLEGNLEAHELMTASLDELGARIHEAVSAGSRDKRRHILCSSSGYMEDPNPSETLIRNEIFYIEEGIRAAEEYARH